MPKTKLNILLAKQGVQPKQVISKITNKQEIGEGGTFWYKDALDKKPQWLDNFFDGNLNVESLKTKTIQAVFIKSVKVSDNEDRVFALTFGYGHSLLKLDQFEERFGIITALNLISADKIRTADTNTLGSTPKSRRTQLGKLSKITELDLDGEYDLLKSIGGWSDIGNNKILSGISTVNGKMSLSISKEITYDKIDDMLKELFLQFKSDAYKKRFPDIDHIIEIKDTSVIDQLNKELLTRLNSDPPNLVGIELSCPEIITWDTISGFKYTKNSNVYEDLSIKQLIKYLKQSVNYGKDIEKNDLNKREILSIDQNGNHLHSWSIYKCLVADIKLNDSQYTLDEGKWFKFDDNYVKNVLDYYSDAEISNLNLPACDLAKKESEGDYNKRVSEQSEKYIHMDTDLQHPEKQTPFEVCDILTTDKEFVHIKKGITSANLSHLFLQGLVSAEILNNHVQTRIELANKSEDIKRVIDADNFTPRLYTVTFGIITKKSDERPEIPFFSKITFRNVSRTLQKMGYKVNLLKIDWK